MTRREESEAALIESDRMRILASQYKQSGFKAMAKWLRNNADAALKFAAERGVEDEGQG